MSWTILLAIRGLEFRVRDALTYDGTPAYVPVEFRGSKAARHRPIAIAPGYVFADVSDWGMLRAVDGLASRPILMMGGKIATVTPDEMSAVEALSKSIAGDDAPSAGHGYKPGDVIQIRLGALAVVDALVARVSKKGNPVALVELFGKTNEVVVSPNMIV